MRGVGDKTATKLLQQYGSVEAIYEHLDEISSSRFRNALEEGRDDGLSQQAPGDHRHRRAGRASTWRRCRVGEFDRERVVELFRELEFRALLDRLPEPGVPGWSAGTPEEASPSVSIVWRRSRCKPWADGAGQQRADYQIVDSARGAGGDGRRAGQEPQAAGRGRRITSIDPMAARLVGIALSGRGGQRLLRCPSATSPSPTRRDSLQPAVALVVDTPRAPAPRTRRSPNTRTTPTMT